MAQTGRNDPCPCGSGRKHKRCCLDIEQTARRVAAEAEARIEELGDRSRHEAPAQWCDAYERTLAPLNGGGLLLREMASWLNLWLVCDAPVIEGRTPLAAYGADEPRSVDERLESSAIGAWWLRGSDFPAPATPWRRDDALTLHCDREPLGAMCDGALLVGRAIQVTETHAALVGRPVVVDEQALDDVLYVLQAAPADALCAALRWPEVREHTAEGELVRQCLRRYELVDPEAALASLQASRRATEQDLLGYYEGDVTFYVSGGRLAGVVAPPRERGVTWELCEEDHEDPPRLGEVTVSPADAELILSAPTRSRVERLAAALPWALRSSLGPPLGEHLDGPEVMPRVSRERLERWFAVG
jgi:hypothetical protein